MKLFRLDGNRIGVIAGDIWHDVTDALDTSPAAWPPTQMVSFIASLNERGLDAVLADPAVRQIAPAPEKLLTPIEWPNKLICYPANYQKHREEMNSANRADKNRFFLKANSSLSGPNDPIVMPTVEGREVHHECELGIIIGKRGRHIAREDYADYIFGYTCLIDMVIRGPEERVWRKSWDSFCPNGPWIATADEVPDVHALDLRLWVNGELRQSANTRDLILDIPGMIAMASEAATLMPGDIIATGTPEGVGPVQAGDAVRILVDHVGEMNLKVVAP
ncbi:fumarylacetoacetate hydrolase family protein [Sphingobium sp. HBC34]|uniref:Fumarylacetoacetate hydrolase family protein n=1 Tax=Sphingobium cyanobacteriorum TaxID=3063954 RepID=A0ABT8ZQA0_9SPHN|nr:fumarylacetoacetate hydrolase family protein [Sphingobium sp. HBC34]MDO7836361.1 fumarylacetoacetate hydrolase family protein [Sphingobium sp. HBC34]